MKETKLFYDLFDGQKPVSVRVRLWDEASPNMTVSVLYMLGTGRAYTELDTWPVSIKAADARRLSGLIGCAAVLHEALEAFDLQAHGDLRDVAAWYGPLQAMIDALCTTKSTLT